MLGSSSSASFIVPKRSRSDSQPSTQPGTDQLSWPKVGISDSPFSLKACIVAWKGARPLALSANNLPAFASQTRACKSPPMPQVMGSKKPKAALVAMAASIAFPPRLSTSSPIWAARGWLVATMPCVARTTLRPLRNGARACRSPASAEKRTIAKGRATMRSVKTSRMAIRPAAWSDNESITGPSDEGKRFRSLGQASKCRHPGCCDGEWTRAGKRVQRRRRGNGKSSSLKRWAMFC
jgi:hypothetical protein